MTNRWHLTPILCLSYLTCLRNSEAQNLYPVSKITWHLSAVCGDFAKEVVEESNVCNSEVIDEVHDHAENVRIPGYDGDLVEDYLDAADNGLLCFADGLTVRRLQNACDCMRRVCDLYRPRNVDRCSSIVLSPFAPNGNTSSPRLGHRGYGPAFNCYGYRCLTISPALVRSHAVPVARITSRWMMMMVVVVMVIVSVSVATALR